MCAKETGKQGTSSKRHRAGVMVHEMTHIQAVSGNRTIVDVLYNERKVKEAGLSPVNVTAVSSQTLEKGCYGNERVRKLAKWSPSLAVLNADSYGVFTTQLARHENAKKLTWSGLMDAIDIWIEDHPLAAASIIGSAALGLFLLFLLCACCCHRMKTRRHPGRPRA